MAELQGDKLKTLDEVISEHEVFGVKSDVLPHLYAYRRLLKDSKQWKEDSKIMNALRCGGVDNWEGYEYSMEEFYSPDEDE